MNKTDKAVTDSRTVAGKKRSKTNARVTQFVNADNKLCFCVSIVNEGFMPHADEGRVLGHYDNELLEAAGVPEFPIIDVIVEGGVIQDVLNVPKGITVRVIDYDIDGADPEHLSPSPYDDNEAIISEY